MTKAPDLQPSDLKAVIFDLDGVIFDSRQANIVFYNHLLEHVGMPPNAARTRSAVGVAYPFSVTTKPHRVIFFASFLGFMRFTCRSLSHRFLPRIAPREARRVSKAATS